MQGLKDRVHPAPQKNILSNLLFIKNSQFAKHEHVSPENPHKIISDFAAEHFFVNCFARYWGGVTRPDWIDGKYSEHVSRQLTKALQI